jgi:3'-phosphoadenosine 5'-phosphosulfate sulfotransferase (PAPS reductase)/FAD synthetase
MAERRTVVWYSCGAASAVAAHLTLRGTPDAVLAYCETGGEHEDNERFLQDCVRWLNTSVIRLKSAKFVDTWDVWTRERYLAGINGAPCTRALKFRPRLEWQLPDDIHVFGYTADKMDAKRADTLRENYPELDVRTPLIDAGLTKASCLAIIESAGIDLPVMYKLGFHNNNCIPCVKAQSPAYWALIREKFPAEFERMAKLSRDLKVRLCKIKGERRFIDEIPADQSTINPIAPSCDFLCEAVTSGLEAAE